MLQSFRSLVQEFRDDERGMFAVIFGLMAIVLIAFAGSVVDFNMFQQRRAVAQNALDAAVLGLQGNITTANPDEISEYALSLLTDRIRDVDVSAEIINVSVDPTKGSLSVTAKLQSPTYFVTLVGVHSIDFTVQSEATRKSERIEIALVLDNSGSMAEENRMHYLQQAARKAVSTFFADSKASDPHVFVGVVPFTQYVNVGAHNANQPWIDRFGRSSIADDNMIIDSNAPIQNFDRIALFNTMRTERWRGCVEARVFPYDTDDTPPSTAQPDTLFLPLLAPDEPDTRTWLGTYVYNNHYIEDEPRQCESPPRWQSWSERTLQERMCKYSGASLVRATSMQQARGPNADCPYNALTPLSSNESSVQAALNGMSPQGGTNIAQGAVWGLHMLTPSLPLNEASEFTQSVAKTMILMTDGDNFHSASSNMNGSIFYTAYGYPHNRRLGKPGDSTATLQRLMDDRLLATCKSAKALGIKIYTIGLSVPSKSTQEKLQECSSGEGYYYLPKRPSELDQIFEDIVRHHSLLRLSR